MTQNIVKNRYTSASIPDKIKKELATIKFDVEEYKIKIDEYKKIGLSISVIMIMNWN